MKNTKLFQSWRESASLTAFTADEMVFISLAIKAHNRPLFVGKAKTNVAVLLYRFQRKETQGTDRAVSGLFN